MSDLITDPDLLAGYLTDASNTRGRADALVRPRSTEEVADVVRHCQARGIPLTVTAARTSTTGAPLPDGGWLLSTEHLTAIEHLDRDQATAQAGVNLGVFQDAVEASGRLFPPDPTSRRDCTLGGAVACNASGARSFRYGPTRRWIEALEVVLPTGEVVHASCDDPVPATWPRIAWREPAVKTAAGYAPPSSWADLFVGQEGTLGVITRVTARLAALPQAVLGVIAFFRSRPDAVAFMRAARTSSRADPRSALSPQCIEYLDARCLDLARERLGDVPEGASAALFCEQEVTGDELAHLDAWLAALTAHRALVDHTLVTTDAAGRDKLHALRHAIPAAINERVVRHRMPKVGTDLAVPDHALDQMMDAYEATRLDHVLFGHLGDNHLHLNMLPRTDDELAAARARYAELARLALRLGGTVSAEHGIGRLKREALAEMVGPEVLAQFIALKRHLDPGWILGRGVVIRAPAPPGPS
jgi:D-lactate dehydrogenase (cytochrome)